MESSPMAIVLRLAAARCVAGTAAFRAVIGSSARFGGAVLPHSSVPTAKHQDHAISALG